MVAYQCKFDNLLIIDFATTSQESTLDFTPEIIKFSVSVLDVKHQRIREDIFFNEYCQPEYHPFLSELCIRTTGVQQENVNYALPFREVYNHFVAWLREHNFDEDKFAFACHTVDTLWKNAQCQFILMQTPLPSMFRQWFNISYFFLKTTGRLTTLPPQNYLSQMASHYGVQLQGEVFDSRNHSINLAHIVKRLLDNGINVDVNFRLTCVHVNRHEPFHVNEAIEWDKDPLMFFDMTKRILPLMYLPVYRPLNVNEFGKCPHCRKRMGSCTGLEHEQYPESIFKSLRLTSRPFSLFASHLALVPSFHSFWHPDD